MNLDTINCGLDFGTSNSVISITDKKTKKEVFTYSDKSILYFPETNDLTYLVGQEAQDMYIREQMRGRLLKSVKTLLKQDKFLFTWIYGKKVTPEQLSMFIISHLKKKAEEFLGFQITDVTLGRPAIFSEDPQQEALAVKRLLKAAKDAGFINVKLQLEPIAAAFYYESLLDSPKNVLVADFGGGTSDFTVMKLSPENSSKVDRSEDIIANDGIYIGGDVFDSEIMWHKVTPHLGRGVTYRSYDKDIEVPNTIFHELKRWERSFLLKESKSRRSMEGYYFHSGNNALLNNLRVLIDNNYTYSLFKSIEQSKMALSVGDQAELTFQREDMEISDVLPLADFNQYISKHIDEIEQKIDLTLEKASMTVEDIDSVFVTGGSSFVQLVRAALYKRFDPKKVHIGDAFNSVAFGLALS